MEHVKQLQMTQEEMMKKLSIMDEEHVNGNGGVVNGGTGDQSEESTPRPQKKFDTGKEGNSSTKRHRWKNWGWKHSPAKSSSIEEEPQLESPRKSQPSSKNSTPNQSPKHKYKIMSSDGTLNSSVNDELLTPFRRKKHQQVRSDNAKTEHRSSAGARLFQMFDSKDGIESAEAECDEFYSLIPANGRPASIHIIHTTKPHEDF